VKAGKDFAWGAFAVAVEGGVERGWSTPGDRLRDPSRMLIRRRGIWLGALGELRTDMLTYSHIENFSLKFGARGKSRDRGGGMPWIYSVHCVSTQGQPGGQLILSEKRVGSRAGRPMMKFTGYESSSLFM
jgi:hypothetical protein